MFEREDAYSTAHWMMACEKPQHPPHIAELCELLTSKHWLMMYHKFT